MKNVIWFSRHDMTQPQLQALKSHLGEDIEITKVDGTAPNVHVPFEAKVNNSEELSTSKPLKVLVGEYDHFCAVLPINLQQQILPFLNKEGKALLTSTNKRLPDGVDEKGEQQYRFEFDAWLHIKKIEVVSEVVAKAP